MKSNLSANKTHSDSVCDKDSITAKLLEIDEYYNYVPAEKKEFAEFIVDMILRQMKRLSEGEYVN